MAAKTEQELRELIADYRLLRTRTRDDSALEAINRIIKDAEQQLEALTAKQKAPPKDS